MGGDSEWLRTSGQEGNERPTVSSCFLSGREEGSGGGSRARRRALGVDARECDCRQGKGMARKSTSGENVSLPLLAEAWSMLRILGAPLGTWLHHLLAAGHPSWLWGWLGSLGNVFKPSELQFPHLSSEGNSVNIK